MPSKWTRPMRLYRVPPRPAQQHAPSVHPRTRSKVMAAIMDGYLSPRLIADATGLEVETVARVLRVLEMEQ